MGGGEVVSGWVGEGWCSTAVIGWGRVVSGWVGERLLVVGWGGG